MEWLANNKSEMKKQKISNNKPKAETTMPRNGFFFLSVAHYLFAGICFLNL